MALSDSGLSADVVTAAVLVYADFADLPLRVAYANMPITVAATGITDADSDCAGFTFDNATADLLSLGTVSHGDGGTDTLTITLTADPTSLGLMDAVENPALYAGRTFRLWQVLHNGAGAVIELQPLYRGYMTLPSQAVDSQSMTITMEIENYRAVYGSAQGRTYLSQAVYDAGDTSANVTIGQGDTAPGVNGGGSRGDDRQWVQLQ